jgi:hypothetical protein
LAREPSADRVNGNSIGSKPVCGEVSDVGITLYLWPVFRQNLLAVGINLALGDGLETAGALQAKFESPRCPQTVKAS